MSSVQLVKNVIDSLCYNCCKRLFHFQLFTVTTTVQSANYYWIIEYLNEKKQREQNPGNAFSGCGICFGLLEKFSHNEYLTQLANEINSSGIQFKDFRISATMPNQISMREKFIVATLNSIPSSDVSLKIHNPSGLSVKEQWKILTFHPLELIVGKPYNHNGPFDVKIRFSIENSDEDNKLLDSRTTPVPDIKIKRLSKKARMQKEVQEKGFTKPNVDQLLNEASYEKMQEFYTLPFKRQLCETQTECAHDPIYLAGRYLKFSRTLPQTAWIIGGERRIISSIEEIIGNVLKKELGAAEFTFTASGREDVDVRCLNEGRPFIMEFYEPKRTAFTKQEMLHYQKLINLSTQDVAVKNLQYITRNQTKLIREGQEDKSKEYSSLCYCYSKIDESDIQKLNEIATLKIFQKTPIRVLHRRTLLTRERTISNVRAELVDDHHFRFKLTTQAGTYVKELVHGDLGRTEPSLCTILNKECDILELDVEAVNLDFPPATNSDGEEENGTTK